MTERRRRKPISTVEPAQPASMPPSGVTTILCARCGGHYIDAPPGRDAHQVVFGHTPAPKDDGKDN